MAAHLLVVATQCWPRPSQDSKSRELDDVSSPDCTPPRSPQAQGADEMQKGNASFMGGDCTPPRSSKPPSATHFGGGIRSEGCSDEELKQFCSSKPDWSLSPQRGPAT